MEIALETPNDNYFGTEGVTKKELLIGYLLQGYSCTDYVECTLVN